MKLLEGVRAQLVSRSVVAFLLKLLKPPKPCSRRVDGLASRVVVSRLKRELLYLKASFKDDRGTASTGDLGSERHFLGLRRCRRARC